MLPPGVNAKDFADALKQLEGAVGKPWVFTSDEDVALYRDAYSPFWGEPEERTKAQRLKDGVPTGEYEDFVTGFVLNDNEVWGRPVGVAVAHDGALLISEDGNGTIWRVTHQ